MTWRQSAACLTRPDLLPVWTGDDQEPSRTFEAKCVCWSCPSIDECEADLLATPFDRAYSAGVIAGTSELDRHGTRGRPAKHTPILCGTRSGYARHRRKGEDACDPCRRANTEYVSAWKAMAS